MLENQHRQPFIQKSPLLSWWTVTTHLNSIDHGTDGVLCDVIQAQLKGCHHHASLQLAPCGQQKSVGAETQLLLLTSHLPWAERLGGTQRVLRLETMLKNQTGYTNIQMIQAANPATSRLIRCH